MKHRQTHYIHASFAILFFIMLGYVIKFYPESLAATDSSIQKLLRGDLPALATQFFKIITQLGNEIGIFIAVFLLALILYFWKNWKAEAYFLSASLLLISIFSTAFKYLYNRPRPHIAYLITKPMGPSFPSWHSASTMIVAMVIIVIIQQRMKRSLMRFCLQAMLLILAILTALSRIYLGVHYPSDVLGSWLLDCAVFSVTYPFYDQKRFEWRFQSKQK